MTLAVHQLIRSVLELRRWEPCHDYSHNNRDLSRRPEFSSGGPLLNNDYPLGMPLKAWTPKYREYLGPTVSKVWEIDLYEFRELGSPL
jgi:hypothetical protein